MLSNNLKPKILLINPPFYRLKNISNLHFPLGLGYISAKLTSCGYENIVYNTEITKEKASSAEKAEDIIRAHSNFIRALNDSSNFVWMEIREVIRKISPDIVGMTVLSTQAKSARNITDIIREIAPKCSVVWGGAHPSIYAQRILQSKDADFVIRGEGEEPFVELCDVLFRSKGAYRFSAIKGLSYAENGQIRHNPDRPLVQSLDSLPYPDKKNILDFEYLPKNSLGDIIGSRGCPFNCSFCSAPEFWQRKVRFRSPENIVGEIEGLMRNCGIREFYFWDDSFTVNKDFVYKFCDLVIAKKMHIAWSCRTRADLLDEKMIVAMKKAGCIKYDIGIESGSPKILEYIAKDASIDKFLRMSKMLNRHNMLWSGFFMIGIPVETQEDLNMTIDFMKTLNPPVMYGSIYTPLPGTKIFDDLVADGTINEQEYRFERYSSYSEENFFLKYVSQDEFKAYISKFFKIIDKHNNSRGILIERIVKRWKFWLYNPGLFLRKVFNYAK